MASSDDLVKWSDHRVLMQANPKSDWEAEKIGIAGPPIKMENSWLLIYHGVSKSHRYSLGIAELDLEDPTKVLSRQVQPILEPKLDWEVNGHVPNVVFSCGQVILDDVLYVYYGAADTVIGAASIPLEQIKFS